MTPSERTTLLETSPDGLWCAEGGFHVDPWNAVTRAVVTHGHSDHARAGCGSYLTSARGVSVLRRRVGYGATITGLALGRAVTLGNVRVSLHPAGHILGSAQVRVERVAASSNGPAGEVLVFSGDYKAGPDPTCDAFETVRCHTFITESTFALPIYRWKPQDQIAAEINAWWRQNRERGRTSVVFAYALGKAQRVLALLDTSIGPIGTHGAVRRMNEAYAEAGVKLPEVLPATGPSVATLKGAGLVVAPPSADGSPWLKKLEGPQGVSTASASGWMQVRGARRWRSLDRGFVLSDHADWPGLLESIEATGAERVGVTHGRSAVLARWLNEHGRSAYVVESRFTGETPEAWQRDGEGEIEDAEESPTTREPSSSA